MTVRQKSKAKVKKVFTKVRGSAPTCTHRHGCPSNHPHGRNAVAARGRYGDRGRVESCRGDAVWLHNCGVMDHMWLSRIHWLSVVRSLSGRTKGYQS